MITTGLTLFVLALGAAPQSQLLEPVDQVIQRVEAQATASKCDCNNAADCTCKKGTCKCAKCGTKKPKPSRMPSRMIEPLEGRSNALELPKLPDARHDASTGVFI